LTDLGRPIPSSFRADLSAEALATVEVLTKADYDFKEQRRMNAGQAGHNTTSRQNRNEQQAEKNHGFHG